MFAYKYSDFWENWTTSTNFRGIWTSAARKLFIRFERVAVQVESLCFFVHFENAHKQFIMFCLCDIS